MEDTNTEQGTAVQIARLAEQLKELKEKAGQHSEYAESVAKLESDITALGLKLTTLQSERASRRAEFNQQDADDAIRLQGNIGYGHSTKAVVEAAHKNVRPTPEQAAFQNEADNLYILSNMLGVKPHETEYAQKLAQRSSMWRKALDTTAGAAWIPTDMSATLKEKIRLSLKVAGLHTRIEMPTPVYVLPIEGADGTAYLVSEQGGIDDDLDENKRVPAAGNLQSSPGFTNLTLTAKKLGARLVTSAELTEDSIIPMLPYLQNKIVMAMAQAQEDAVINGKLSGGHFDSDVSASNDHRKAWNGYRHFARTTGTQVAAAATTLDIANIRSLRQKMALYGLNPANLVLVTGGVGYNKLLSLKDGSNPSPILTVDKYGPQATIITGEIGKVDGIPIILSEFVRENLNPSGVYDGVTTNSTLLLMVNREQFLFGDYRAPTLESRRIIETDQTVLVTMARMTFRGWFESDPTVGQIYDLRA